MAVSAKHSRSSRVCRSLVASLILAITFTADAVVEVTPADNALVYSGQVGAHSSFAASVVGSLVAPPPLDLSFDATALASEQILGFYPPTFDPPNSFAEFPNQSRTGSVDGASNRCVFRFREKTDPDAEAHTSQGLQDTFASVWSFPVRFGTEGFADLGKPLVYHPYGEVKVNAHNEFLTPEGYPGLSSDQLDDVRSHPEFPEGTHAIDWSGEKMVNPVIDIALPSALFATFTLAEFRIGQKAGKRVIQRNYKGFRKSLVDLATKLELAGTTGYDLATAIGVDEFFEETSFVSGRNSETQVLTVWDTHAPYFVNNNGSRIETQVVTLEAQDFGGIRFDRARAALENQFSQFDDCNKPLILSTETPPGRLLTLDNDNEVEWQSLDRGPFNSTIDGALFSNQTRDGEEVTAKLRQIVRVVDTQPPLLVPPDSFALEASSPITPASGFDFLGRPLVVDRADPDPFVDNDAPTEFTGGTEGQRYVINWWAFDDSGNDTRSDPRGLSPYQQTVTIKPPNSNNAPTAEAPGLTNGITSQSIEIELRGSDPDIIGGPDLIEGIADPLAFEIDRYPRHGEFEAPLLPYFIDDYRLTPLGERREADTLSRVSPLGEFAEGFIAERTERGRQDYLNANFCNHPTNPREIPADFVYQPRQVRVDDDGNTTILDWFWMCDSSRRVHGSYLSGVSLLYQRLSKWTDDGELIAMLPLEAHNNPALEPSPWSDRPNTFVREFSADHNQRVWLLTRRQAIGNVNGFEEQVDRYEIFSVNGGLRGPAYHGSTDIGDESLFFGASVDAVVGDAQYELLFELRSAVGQDADPITGGSGPHYLFTEVWVRQSQPDAQIGRNSGVVARYVLPGRARATAMQVDSEGNLYVLDTAESRVHKFSPTVRKPDGNWQRGDYVGWMGRCSSNKSINGVPFNACDEARGLSMGYACADNKCARDTGDAGSDAGQFDGPRGIAISPRGILYVADTNNSRVQRFGPDGTFAGSAESTGDGLVEGDNRFILGNMGNPVRISVNSSSFHVMEDGDLQAQFGDFFVHVYKTMPFYDITNSTAKVKYVSHFDHVGPDQFSFRVDDGIAESPSVAVDLSISRAFRPPERLRSQCSQNETVVFNEISCGLGEDSSIFVRLSSYDPDGFNAPGVDGLDTHSFTIERPPQHGELELISTAANAAIYRYEPNENFNGIDRFEFSASDGVLESEANGEVELQVFPRPDPVAVRFPEQMRAARGFPAQFALRLTDPDNDPNHQAPLTTIEWGDGTATTGPDWSNSGRTDANGREISPHLEFDRGDGLLAGSHVYSTAGTAMLHVVIDNREVDDTDVSAPVSVIPAVVLAADLEEAADAVTPEAEFPLSIRITNRAPLDGVGLPAPNLEAAFELPEGLTLTQVDALCSGNRSMTCNIGELANDTSHTLNFQARISLAAARDAIDHSLTLELSHSGPSLFETSVARLAVAIADTDGDDVIDVDDAFVNDERYSKDSDGDGLADAWERTYGFDADVADDVNVDLDGDGRALEQEFSETSFPLLQDRVEHQPGTRLEAPADLRGDDRFGIALTGGDLNDDGFAETIVGATGAGDSGTLFISWGGPDGATEALLELQPSSPTASYANAIALGDWNGSGLPDLAISHANGVDIHFNNGEILAQYDVQIGVSGTTRPVNGDLDGDGRDDLILVNPTASGGTRLRTYLSSAAGVVASGTPSAPTGDFELTDARLVEGAAVADVDGDGAADLVLGDGNDGGGLVRVFRGADNDFGLTPQSPVGVDLRADGSLSRFGFALASGADVTGDGIDDLVVGAYGGAGAIVLYDSADRWWEAVSPSGQVLRGDTAGAGDTHSDQLGVSVALGHLDQDGFADVIAGGNRAGGSDEGELRIYRGSSSGLVAPGRNLPGETPWDLLGYQVFIPGDVDGDGVADIAAGAPNLDTAQSPEPDGGYVRLYYHRYTAIDPSADLDDDGVAASFDNCPDAGNTDQADLDSDTLGDVCDSDADGDSIDDKWERDNGFDAADASDASTDSDSDSLTNAQEFQLGTSPRIADSDGDGVDDGTELNRGTDPLAAEMQGDADGDGLPDSVEVAYGLNLNDPTDAHDDLDVDGFTNLEEHVTKSRLELTPVQPQPADCAIDFDTALSARISGSIETSDCPLLIGLTRRVDHYRLRAQGEGGDGLLTVRAVSGGDDLNIWLYSAGLGTVLASARTTNGEAVIEAPLTASASPDRHLLVAPVDTAASSSSQRNSYALELSFAGPEVGDARVVASLLPASRSVEVGRPASAFATVINTSDALGEDCTLTPQTDVPADYFYQRTDPATNQPIGEPNTFSDIAPGAAQSYVFGFTPNAAFAPTDIAMGADCLTGPQAPIFTGLNTFLLSASETPVADIVALVATVANDGVVSVPGSGGAAAFAVATLNVGASSAISVSADTGSATLPVDLLMCETDPASGQCINPVVPSTQVVQTIIDGDATPTFAIFVQARGDVPFDPANHRVFVRFSDSNGMVRGATSVAVRTDGG